MGKRYTYVFENERVYLLKRRKVAYLRSKACVEKGTVEHSLRTQASGKGSLISKVGAVPAGDKSTEALKKLYKKVPFAYVILQDAYSQKEVGRK